MLTSVLKRSNSGPHMDVLHLDEPSRQRCLIRLQPGMHKDESGV